MVGEYTPTMAQSREGLKGVVSRLSPELFQQFKLFCLQNELSVGQAIEIAIRWQLLNDYTSPPDTEGK